MFLRTIFVTLLAIVSSVCPKAKIIGVLVNVKSCYARQHD